MPKVQCSARPQGFRVEGSGIGDSCESWFRFAASVRTRTSTTESVHVIYPNSCSLEPKGNSILTTTTPKKPWRILRTTSMEKEARSSRHGLRRRLGSPDRPGSRVLGVRAQRGWGFRV